MQIRLKFFQVTIPRWLASLMENAILHSARKGGSKSWPDWYREVGFYEIALISPEGI